MAKNAGRLVVALALAGTLGTLGVTSALAGNDDAAHACQQGGYRSQTRDDGSHVRNVGECVSYFARELGNGPSI